MLKVKYYFNWDGSFAMNFYDGELYIGWCHSIEDFKIHYYEYEDYNKIKKFLQSINIV